MGFLTKSWGTNTPYVGVAPAPPASADLGLFSAFPFNEAAGLTAYDAVRGKPVVIAGTSPYLAGIEDGCSLSFDGSTSQVPPITGFSSAGALPFSMSMWVYQTTNSSYRALWSSSVPRGLYLLTGKGNWFQGSDHLATTAIPLSVWTQVGICTDGVNTYHYMNGLPNGSNAAFVAQFDDVSGGIGNDSAGNRFVGNMRNVLLASRCWTPEEWLRLYQEPFRWMQSPKGYTINSVAAGVASPFNAAWIPSGVVIGGGVY